MRLFVLMGVSGSGKSTVGEALAPLLGGVYLDGDRFHSPENIVKMTRGVPLTDADRRPWLKRVGEELAMRSGIVIAGCSALRRAYRDIIRRGAVEPVGFVHLAGSRDQIASRLAERTGHFMPKSLLDSQFASLEPPGPDEVSVAVDIGQAPAAIANEIQRKLRAAGFVT